MVATALKAKTFRRADGSPRRVLYAEDQTSSRVVTTAMLKRMGFEVDAVEDGELALQHARTQSYDVILLDIEMPVMDGVTAARSIRQQLSHCNDTPILAMSAFLADSTEACVWRDAFDSALPKPANSNELHRALAEAMNLKDKEQAHSSFIQAVPEPAEILLALQKSMSPGSWRKLQATAAHEMHHLVLVMSAAVQAQDAETFRKARHAIKGLALNFGGAEIVEKCAIYVKDKSEDSLMALLAAISAWQLA